MGCDPSIELPCGGSTNEGSQPMILLKMCQVKEISKNYNQILPIFRVLHYSAEKSSCNPDCRGKLYVGDDQPAHLSKQMFIVSGIKCTNFELTVFRDENFPLFRGFLL